MEKYKQILILIGIIFVLSFFNLDTQFPNISEDADKNLEEPKISRPLQNYSVVLDSDYDWINTTGATLLSASHSSGMGEGLPFSFPFYDQEFSYYYITGRSGFISFKDFYWSSSGFPDETVKRAVAVFTNDLEPSTGGIYKKILTSPNRFVLIFDNVSYWNGGAGSPVAGTFEMILYQTGMIKLQYKEIKNVQDNPFCGVNRGDGDNFFNSYENFNDTITNYAIDFIYPQNDNAPKLTAGQVLPTSGNQKTIFTYTVTYTDSDNTPPNYVNVLINNTSHSMHKQNPSDYDYTDGCLYELSLYLQPGTYNYSFSTYDGNYYNTTLPIQNSPIVSKTNSDDPILNNGQVNPLIAYANLTLYNFTVNYTDSDNNAPESINITLDGQNHSMSQINFYDDNYMDGCTFQYLTTLSSLGYHQFSYSCFDGIFSATDGPYSNLYVKSSKDYHNLSLTGFKIGSVLGYGADNPFEEYEDLKDILLYRGAELYNITDTLNSTILQEYDLVWFDDSGSNPPSEDLDDLYDWVNNGGTILITGGYGYGQKDDVIAKFGMQVFSYDTEHTGITYEISAHPITRNVNQFYTGGLYYPININSKPEAFSCIRGNGYHLGVALEQGIGAIAILTDWSCFDDYQLTQADNLLVANNTFGWLCSITNANLNEPTLTEEDVNPKLGNQSTLFTYTVNYTDVEDNPPVSIKVLINSSSYDMGKENPSDNNYTDGCIFEYKTYLNWSEYPYNYSFECFDGEFFNSTATYSDPTVSYVNFNTPILSDGNVDPIEGEVGLTIFNFTVNYTDAENNPPSFVNITLDGVNYTMTQVDPFKTDYMDGCIFEYTSVLNGIMTHEFNFTANDSKYTVFLATFNNPKTNDTTAPILSNGDVNPTVGTPGTVFNFTIEIWDYSGIDSATGYVQKPDENTLDSITFFDDGMHNDGGSGDGLWGGSWNSAGYESGLYYLDVNVTDLTAEHYESEYENIAFGIINWSCKAGEEYHWNITRYYMPLYAGNHMVINVTKINMTSSTVSAVWGNYVFFNATNGQYFSPSSFQQIENYNLSSQLYDMIYMGGLFIPFLVLPINMQKINESIMDIYFNSMMYMMTYFESKIYENNYTISYNFSVMGMEYLYIFQWNDLGINNQTVIYMYGTFAAQYDLLGPDEVPPRLLEVDVIPEIEVKGTLFNVTARAIDTWGVKNVTAIIEYPDLMTQDVLVMYDDGNHNDGHPLDGVWGVSWDSTGKNAGIYNITINATDNNGLWNLFEDILNITVTDTDISPPIILSSNVNPEAGNKDLGEIFNITAKVYDSSGVSSVVAYIQYPDENIIATITMYDDGSHNDGGSGDGTWGGSWNSGTQSAGIYYIDFICTDINTNYKEYENVLNFIFFGWGVSIGDVLIFNVTYNDMPGGLPFSSLPEGFLYRADILNNNYSINPYHGQYASVLWGNTYQFSGGPFWAPQYSMSALVDFNTTINHYYDFLIPIFTYFLASIVPTPVWDTSLSWVYDTGYFDTIFNPIAFSHEIYDSSIYIYYMIPGYYDITMDYNSFGIMSNYVFDYLGYRFEMELFLYETNSDNGQLINPGATNIGSNNIEFTITYKNAKSIPPIYVNVTIDGVSYQLNQTEILDFNYIYGVTFQFKKQLSASSHSYKFEFFDGIYTHETVTYTIDLSSSSGGGDDNGDGDGDDGDDNGDGNGDGELPGGITPEMVVALIAFGTIGGILVLFSVIIVKVRKKKPKKSNVHEMKNDTISSLPDEFTYDFSIPTEKKGKKIESKTLIEESFRIEKGKKETSKEEIKEIFEKPEKATYEPVGWKEPKQEFIEPPRERPEKWSVPEKSEVIKPTIEEEIYKPPEPKKPEETIVQEDVQAELPESVDHYEPPAEGLPFVSVPKQPSSISTKKVKIASMCAWCNTVTYVAKDTMAQFSCPNCKHPILNIVYHCSTCNQNFTIKKEDFLGLTEGQILNCPVCSRELDLMEFEE